MDCSEILVDSKGLSLFPAELIILSKERHVIPLLPMNADEETCIKNGLREGEISEEIRCDMDKYFVLLEINLFTVGAMGNCQNTRVSL